MHRWIQNQRLLFAHQRNLLDQICHKVIQIDYDGEEGEGDGEDEGKIIFFENNLIFM